MIELGCCTTALLVLSLALCNGALIPALAAQGACHKPLIIFAVPQHVPPCRRLTLASL